ncbi:hypothetical protein P9112_013166 [Eukaryota sp. TZLM1-RC]
MTNSYLSAPILLVGAGGIGCEALKALLYTGFTYIDVIDLDTIDVSNLNRQFLFKQADIGQPKATTAAKAVSHLFPTSKITGFLKDITTLTPADLNTYSLVVNALDNLTARRHVNSLCVLSKTPLIESGTRGFQGQSSVHVPYVSECFDCVPKPPPKELPVCTIRGVPTKAEHAIAWAKTVFETLVGVNEDRSMDDLKLSFEMGEVEAAKLLFLDNPRVSARLARVDFDGDLIDYDLIEKVYNEVGDEVCVSNRVAWSIVTALKMFFKSFNKLKSSSEAVKFDKSNPNHLDFVTSCSCLRCHSFKIPPFSQFKVQEIAGNIVPAIATANSIVAALLAHKAYKVASCKEILLETIPKESFLFNYDSSSKYAISSILPSLPNNKCHVCRKTVHSLFLNLSSPFILIINALKKEMSLSEFMIGAKGGRLLYDTDDEGEFYKKSCKDIGIKNGDVLSIEDFNSDSSFLLLIVDANIEGFLLELGEVIESCNGNDDVNDAYEEEHSVGVVMDEVIDVAESDEEDKQSVRDRIRGSSPLLKTKVVDID